MVNRSWNRVLASHMVVYGRALSTLVQLEIERADASVYFLATGRLAALIPNH